MPNVIDQSAWWNPLLTSAIFTWLVGPPLRIFNPYTVGSIFNGRKYHLKLRILTNQGKIEKNIKSLNLK